MSIQLTNTQDSGILLYVPKQEFLATIPAHGYVYINNLSCSDEDKNDIKMFLSGYEDNYADDDHYKITVTDGDLTDMQCEELRRNEESLTVVNNWDNPLNITIVVRNYDEDNRDSMNANLYTAIYNEDGTKYESSNEDGTKYESSNEDNNTQIAIKKPVGYYAYTEIGVIENDYAGFLLGSGKKTTKTFIIGGDEDTIAEVKNIITTLSDDEIAIVYAPLENRSFFVNNTNFSLLSSSSNQFDIKSLETEISTFIQNTVIEKVTETVGNMYVELKAPDGTVLAQPTCSIEDNNTFTFTVPEELSGAEYKVSFKVDYTGEEELSE